MKNVIYEITGVAKTTEKDGLVKISARTTINWNHDIFQGHFPGNPVLPGVVQIRILNDVVNTVLGQDLVMSNASNIKFINMVVPENSGILTIDMNVKSTGTFKYDVSAALHDHQSVFLKLKGIFSPVEMLSNRANP
jgi:3-hydroxyacyl-[acyl-carrier-protein] dehydratase